MNNNSFVFELYHKEVKTAQAIANTTKYSASLKTKRADNSLKTLRIICPLILL